MRDTSLTKLTEDLRGTSWIPQAFSRMARQSPELPVYSQAYLLPDGTREWRTESYSSAARKVWRLAHFLREKGVVPGDRVAILSGTRPEWMFADLAVLYVGATSVSIYQSVNAQETGYILYDAGVKFVFAENQEQVDKLKFLRDNDCNIPAVEDRAAQSVRIRIERVVTFEAVESSIDSTPIASIFDNTGNVLEPVLATGNEIASLVYTSGTTGPPKGVIQTHKNHLANLRQASQTGLFAPNGDIFLFLPLAHSFARLIGYIGFLTPTLIRFPAIPDRKSSVMNATSVLRDLREGSAQVVPMVPRILEKMMNGVTEKTQGAGIGAKMIRTAVESGRGAFEASKNAKELRASQKLVFNLTKILRRKIKSKLFGNNFRHVVSGGAKLPTGVSEFFASLDVAIYEGYGLTETCVATNVNRIGSNKIGSVGPCLDDVQIKIASDGEILFRGPNIALGYYNRPEATRAAWDNDGWFHTGDLGVLDGEGRLSITGRKKELIVTSGGKKISPLMIEEKLVESLYISSAVVLGDGRQYCVALVVPDPAALKHWAERKGIALNKRLSLDSAVIELIERDIEAVNATLSRYETIKKFRVLDIEPSVENGYLTPTFKLKKSLIEREFQALIEEMYADGSAGG